MPKSVVMDVNAEELKAVVKALKPNEIIVFSQRQGAGKKHTHTTPQFVYSKRRGNTH